MEKDKANVNDVDNIRKILFGDQIAQMEERFVQVENSIGQLRSENRSLRQALEAEVTAREEAILEVKNLLENTRREWEQQRGDNFASQADLLTTLLKAIDAYKARIT